MRKKPWVLFLLMMALGCLAMFAPIAGAKPKAKPRLPGKLLPQRSCKGLLSIADFPGAVSESPVLGSLSPFEKGNAHTENYATTCEYNPPERSQADPEPKGGGSDILTVYGRQFYQHTKHQNLTVYEPNTLNSPKYPIHGVGTRAYFLLSKEGDVAEGVLQVRNDLFIIVQEFPTGLRRLLSTVAHELSPTGK
jgi:hypothetical protein